MQPPAENPTSSDVLDNRPWYRLLTRYHWFVFVVAALGWLFDTMDQQLFVFARQGAMTELLGADTEQQVRDQRATVATSIFLVGWAAGGLLFGVLGDRYGRARMMMLTILIYSICTGLSAFSVGFWDFVLWRFLTGLGVGGEFAVGVALIAEVMPARARPYTLGLLQALTTVGNVTAVLIFLILGSMAKSHSLPEGWAPWRLAFLVGTVPALLAILIRWRLKEPERWQAVAGTNALEKKIGSLRSLFSHPRWRKHALLGLALATSGVIALWGIAFFIFDFIGILFKDVKGPLPMKVVAGLTLNAGAFLGMFAFSRVTQRVGRKAAFGLFYPLALLSTVACFWFISEPWHVYVLVPAMGFCILALFGGYAIYFPELFPTRLRSTGTSFCYNTGRFLAAIGTLTLGLLRTEVFGHFGDINSWRYSGVAMSAFLLIGVLVVPFLPETKDQPLPEDD